MCHLKQKFIPFYQSGCLYFPAWQARCCLPLLGAAGGSGCCIAVSWETLGPSPFCYPWCCVVCWPPPTAPLLILRTLYQCMPPASSETIACGPSERSQRSLQPLTCRTTPSHSTLCWVRASDLPGDCQEPCTMAHAHHCWAHKLCPQKNFCLHFCIKCCLWGLPLSV